MTATAELIPADAPTAAVVPASPYLALIDKAIEKGVNPEHLAKFLDLQERWDQAEAKKAYAEAVMRFQAECPPIYKRRTADTGKYKYQYAGYEDVWEVAGPVMERCRLAVAFSTEMIPPGAIKITCNVRHGTHVEPHTLTVPVPSQMVVNDTQKFGAALSYAKRYVFCAAMNVVVTGEDSDAKGLLDTIDAEEKAQIEKLIEEKGVNLAAFMDWVKQLCGAETIDAIPANKFPAVHDALKRKKGGGK